jgi:hypothetical protein
MVLVATEDYGAARNKVSIKVVEVVPSSHAIEQMP